MTSEKSDKSIILTPNAVEFDRLCKMAGLEQVGKQEKDALKKAEFDLFQANLNSVFHCKLEHFENQDSDPLVREIQRVNQISNHFKGAVIFRKGLVDIISDGTDTFIVATAGSLKRCGGQGDVLCGTLGTFANYKFDFEEGSGSAMFASVEGGKLRLREASCTC